MLLSLSLCSAGVSELPLAVFLLWCFVPVVSFLFSFCKALFLLVSSLRSSVFCLSNLPLYASSASGHLFLPLSEGSVVLSLFFRLHSSRLRPCLSLAIPDLHASFSPSARSSFLSLLHFSSRKVFRRGLTEEGPPIDEAGGGGVRLRLPTRHLD